MNSPPLFHPCPIIIKKITIKDLEKRDKELNKSIASLQKQLDELNFEKAKIKCCLDYFQTNQDDFMETVENYHSTSIPQSSPPPSPKSHSPMPLPVLPRPSFFQSKTTSFLSSIPVDNSWSRCDHSTHTYSFHYTSPGGGRSNESDSPLPESFTLFSGCRTPFHHPYYPSPPDSPFTPRKPRDPKPSYRGRCLCYNCICGSGCMWYVHCCTLLLLFWVHLFSPHLWSYFFELHQVIIYCFRFNPSVKQGGNKMISFENGKTTALRIVGNGVKK